MFGQSVGAEQVYFAYNGRCDPAFNAVYRERHMQNPWATFMESQPVGRVVFSDEITELPSIRRTPFFGELLNPQDVPHNAMIALAAKDDFRAAFNICRSGRQGAFGERERRILERLVPHLCRSVRLAFRIEAYRALQGAQYDVLDRLSVGVILLDQRVRIVYANAAARAHGADGGALHLYGGKVAARSPSHARRLDELIHAALRGAPAGAMSAPRPGDGALVTILASSVRGLDVGRFSDLGMADASVLLFIVDPANRAGIPVSWIMDGYGLTRTEARVAIAASSGLTIPETAGRLGISPNTVKTHLRKVFAKTGANRQAELARSFASLSLLRPDGPSGEDV
jgi:DNA-binding CsgD family transcriptional regulator